MNTVTYIVAADVVLIFFFVWLIFGSFRVCIKALLGYFLSDLASESAAYRRWEKVHDAHHKTELLYAAVIGVLLCSFLIYTQL